MSTAASTAERRGLLDRILHRAPQATESARPVPRPRTRHTWPTLVARVRDVTKASAVIAMDEEGIVVASTGDLPDEEMNGIAAHVALAFDLFERLTVLGSTTESVCAQYVRDDTWLTAIRMRPPIGGPMTIGIVGPYTLVREDRRRIRDAFERLFEPTEPSEPSEPSEPTESPA